MAKRYPGDARLKAVEVEGYVVAGTPSAFEAFGPHEYVACVRCGAVIKYIFLTQYGPMGGDCLATLTGDQTTRRIAKKAADQLARMDYWEGIRLEAIELVQNIAVIGKPCLHAVYRQSSEWGSGYRTKVRFLVSAPVTQLQFLAAIGAWLAEDRGLAFRIIPA